MPVFIKYTREDFEFFLGSNVIKSFCEFSSFLIRSIRVQGKGIKIVGSWITVKRSRQKEDGEGEKRSHKVCSESVTK